MYLISYQCLHHEHAEMTNCIYFPSRRNLTLQNIHPNGTKLDLNMSRSTTV